MISSPAGNNDGHGLVLVVIERAGGWLFNGLILWSKRQIELITVNLFNDS
jgi:hypothetical protein